jgi:hypothetical protein
VERDAFQASAKQALTFLLLQPFALESLEQAEEFLPDAIPICPINSVTHVSNLAFESHLIEEVHSLPAQGLAQIQFLISLFRWFFLKDLLTNFLLEARSLS